jgi:hypothetical protein
MTGASAAFNGRRAVELRPRTETKAAAHRNL